MRVEAARALPHEPERVYEFLSDLRNHWLLDPAFLELDVGPAGGRIRMRGPLGISRVAQTRVLAAEPPLSARAGTMAGRADVGGGTVGLVHWKIARDGSGSHVTLSAVVERASALDRALLVLGGRRWLERRFAAALRRLSEVLAP